MPIKKLNQKGASHLIAPIVVTALVALVGVKVLTASHADQISLTTASTTSIGNNVAWEGPLSSNATHAQVMQSQVPFTILGYQQVVYLGEGQSISYINGIKGNIESCYDVYVQPPKAGTVTAMIDIANNNNTATFSLASTTNDNLRRICVSPGTGTNPGYSIKNATADHNNTTIEVVDEQLRW